MMICLSVFLFLIMRFYLEDISSFVGLLFWISGNVSPGFRSHCGLFIFSNISTTICLIFNSTEILCFLLVNLTTIHENRYQQSNGAKSPQILTN